MTKYKILIKWRNGDLTTEQHGGHDDWAEMLKHAKQLWTTYGDNIIAIYYITWQPEMPYKPMLWTLPKIFYMEKEEQDGGDRTNCNSE